MPTPDGGLYISDAEAHVVRHVDPSGIITTAAGTGERGYSGDGRPGNEAALNGPTRLRLDDAGNLYICDTENHVIRRLARDGIITTFAGTGALGYSGDDGPAGAAQLHTPYDVRFSPAGDLYVADTGNNVIRRITPDGIITTVVGTGGPGFAGDGGDARACQLDRPSSVTFDPEGAMWISDTFNQRVRRIADFLSVYD
jgi:streptogramin lyase